MRFALSIAALIGASLLAAPAQAAPLPVSKALSAQADGLSALLQAQALTGPGQQGGRAGRGQAGGSRVGGGGGQRGGGGQHHGGGHRGGHGGGGDDGGAVAAGVLGGLLLGAIIANEAQRGNAVDDCARRYRSYDRRSQNFIGGDGRRYRCP
jgi:hypothetical protein